MPTIDMVADHLPNIRVVAERLPIITEVLVNLTMYARQDEAEEKLCIIGCARCAAWHCALWKLSCKRSYFLFNLYQAIPSYLFSVPLSLSLKLFQ